MEELIKRAAHVVNEADVILITAGAGMGVDSGLPDFRGREGFWKAYPTFAHLELSFSDLANPKRFADDPELAWGFYAHRMALYANATPHEAYHTLLDIVKRKAHHFVYTSNVDGFFVRAGFDPQKIFEVHGNIFWCQCQRNCGQLLFKHSKEIIVDPETMRAGESQLPVCPTCGVIARPNVLMFGDAFFDTEMHEMQDLRYEKFLHAVFEPAGNHRLAIIELGAGTSIPTVRRLGDHMIIAHPRATLIRINLHEPHVYSGQIGIGTSAAEGIAGLKTALLSPKC
mgnify:CR=1 FL=1